MQPAAGKVSFFAPFAISISAFPQDRCAARRVPQPLRRGQQL